MTETTLLGSTKIKDMPFQIIDGDRGTNYPKGHEFSDTGFCLFLSAKNVTKDGFDFAQKQFITEGKDSLLRKGKLERNDIVLTTRGTVGNVALYDETVPYDNVRINSGMIVIRCDKEKILPKYLYFTLKSALFQNQVNNYRSGSAQPQLPIRDMQNMRLPLPSLPEQKNVVNQIGSIDEKIHLNRKMNETLKQMGQAFFRYYFINNPEAEHWEEDSIYKFADIIYGAPFKSELFNERGNGKPLIRIRDLKTQKPGFWTTEIHPRGTLITAGDIVVGMDAEFRPHIWTAGDAWLNQRVCQFIPREGVSRLFILEAIRPWLHFFEKGKIGTTVIHLGKSDIDKFKIKSPPAETLERFSKIANPIYDMRVKKSLEIQALIALRDALLPQLISGRINLK